ncbi:MAG: rhomboid family intramembrane serine protease [Verrucomicrobiae bacterium]|nr:rhomboid family intramembrane serine protease [Verrucomicrobiae bacterium]
MFFVVSTIFLIFRSPLMADAMVLVPADLMAWRFWELVTFPLYQNNILTLLFNFLTFWLFVPSLDSHIGKPHVYGIYIAGSLLGAALFVSMSLLTGNGNALLFGASCAASALFIAFVTLYPEVDFFFGIRAKYWAWISVAITTWFLLVSRNPQSLALLGAMAAGHLYVRSLTSDSFSLAWLTRFNPFRAKKRGPAPYRPQRYQNQKEAETSFISEDVDPILDKISNHGMQSLTAEERRILDKASKKLGK